MYVRDAKNRDEVWLIDHIEAMGLDDEAFRSRDYVIAVNEDSHSRVGFGRLRIHPAEPPVCELTGIGVLESWRGQGVGAHVIERLVAKAGDDEFDTVYVLTDESSYLDQFGFREIDTDELPAPLVGRLDRKRERLDGSVRPLAVDVNRFDMPSRLREAFKQAADGREEYDEPTESAEDFGIDPESATYKYNTGR